MRGYLRTDGRYGIRNHILLVYLGEAAQLVVRRIRDRDPGRHGQVIGFGGDHANPYVQRMLERLCTHPNVGASLLVVDRSGVDHAALADAIRRSGRTVAVVSLRDAGGTRAAIELGQAWFAKAHEALAETPRVDLSLRDLTVGTICGGSDATSVLSANPAIGMAFDRLVGTGATAIFEETGELIGCDHHLAARAANPEVAARIRGAMQKAIRFFDTLGHGSFAPGNADGGLTTIEEKTLGAYAKSGSAPIAGVLHPGEPPPRPGLYLMDKIPDGEVRYGFSDASDNVGVAEMIACGAQVILFSTGRGSVVGSAIAPVIKICANPETFRNLSDDMDIDAGRALEGLGTLADVAAEIYARIERTAAGTPTKSEILGHQEFLLTYKVFDSQRHMADGAVRPVSALESPTERRQR